MRCPKCGYITFDNLENCDKCGKAVKNALGELKGAIFNVKPPRFLRVDGIDDESMREEATMVLTREPEIEEEQFDLGSIDRTVEFTPAADAGTGSGKESFGMGMAEEDVDFGTLGGPEGDFGTDMALDEIFSGQEQGGLEEEEIDLGGGNRPGEAEAGDFGAIELERDVSLSLESEAPAGEFGEEAGGPAIDFSDIDLSDLAPPAKEAAPPAAPAAMSEPEESADFDFGEIASLSDVFDLEEEAAGPKGKKEEKIGGLSGSPARRAEDVVEEVALSETPPARGSGLEDLQVEEIDLDMSGAQPPQKGKAQRGVKTGTALDSFDFDLGDLLTKKKG